MKVYVKLVVAVLAVGLIACKGGERALKKSEPAGPQTTFKGDPKVDKRVGNEPAPSHSLGKPSDPPKKD